MRGRKFGRIGCIYERGMRRRGFGSLAENSLEELLMLLPDRPLSSCQISLLFQ